jgi:hypothetical protein
VFSLGGEIMQLLETRKNRGNDRQLGQVKRKYRRTEILGFSASLSDGKKIFRGVVENVSTGGVEIANLPKSFSPENYTCTVVLSGGGKHYKMLAKPCWSKKRGKRNITIGFKILDASWEWVAFTMNQVPGFRNN